MALPRILQTAGQVHIREVHRTVLRHRGCEEAELLVAEDVAERDLGAAEDIASARNAERHRRTPFEEQLLEGALFVDVGRNERMRRWRREINRRRVRRSEI